MLEDLDIDAVAGAAPVAGPQLGLGEAHAIERHRLARSVVGELLRVAERTAQPLDDALLAADIARRADVARRVPPAHLDRVAWRKARPAHAPPSRTAISASLRPISSEVSTPRC